MNRKIFAEKTLIASLLVLSTILNVFLAIEVTNLRSKNTILSQSEEHQLLLGRNVPNLEIKDLEGKEVEVDFSKISSPSIVYLFSPDCIWCNRNLRNIRHLYENVKDKYNFIGLSISKDSASQYVKDTEIEFPVFTEPSESNRVEYYFRSTPATYVISNEGKIIKYWSGAYAQKNTESIEAYFNIKLPGLVE